MANCPHASFSANFSRAVVRSAPALWYICLWVLSRLHVGYAGMHWVAAAVGFSGVAVLVTASPFPRFIKLLLPFTFYLAFQYAIVARSYVLAPLLIFLCAYFWPRKLERPLTIALCLGLLPMSQPMPPRSRVALPSSIS